MKFGHYNASIISGRLSFEDDGVLFEARSFVDLIKRVSDHRLEHGGDLASGWQHRLGTAYCKQNTDCKSCTNYPADPVRHLNIGDMKLFFKTVNDWVKSGESFCPQEEAERRAKICSACPLNAEIKGCVGCYRLVEKIGKVLGQKSTGYDKDLNGCLACGCNLKVKVWIPSSVVAGTLDESSLPSHCWQLQTSQDAPS